MSMMHAMIVTASIAIFLLRKPLKTWLADYDIIADPKLCRNTAAIIPGGWKLTHCFTISVNVNVSCTLYSAEWHSISTALSGLSNGWTSPSSFVWNCCCWELGLAGWPVESSRPSGRQSMEIMSSNSVYSCLLTNTTTDRHTWSHNLLACKCNPDIRWRRNGEYVNVSARDNWPYPVTQLYQFCIPIVVRIDTKI